MRQPRCVIQRRRINSVKERGRVKQIYAAFMSPWDVDEVFTSPWDVDKVFTSSTISSLLLQPITDHQSPITARSAFSRFLILNSYFLLSSLPAIFRAFMPKPEDQARKGKAKLHLLSSAPADSAPILAVVESKDQITQAVRDSLELLNVHFKMFEGVLPYAEKYGHPHPTDTRGWSQILISALTGIMGLKRKKGTDLEDGSDVKGANTWAAIDTPRFNGVIKAGTKGVSAGTLASLDSMPYLFFVLWDNEPESKEERCRVWSVRTQKDRIFREMASTWYRKRDCGEIISNNFQLHPPRNRNTNIFTNRCGNLEYPLLFEARRRRNGFECTVYRPEVLESGACKAI